MSKAPAGLLIEGEDFTDHGGWVMDSRLGAQMGSPCLLARGLGRPVADATTPIRVPDAGEYIALVERLNSHEHDPDNHGVARRFVAVTG